MTWGFFVEPLAPLRACLHCYSCIPRDAITEYSNTSTRTSPTLSSQLATRMYDDE